MKKKTSIEWLAWKFATTDIEEFKDNFNEYVNQAKKMHKQELESTYNHAMWALMDTGHGDSFDEYYKNTYEKEN